MSAISMSLVLNHSKNTGTNKLVLLGIAWHMSETDNDGAWMGMDRLAQYAGCTKRTVIRALEILEESGELHISRRDGKSYGGPKTNRYWVNVECSDDCDGSMWHRQNSNVIDMIMPVDNFATRDKLGFSR